jgi:hypothetical protein
MMFSLLALAFSPLPIDQLDAMAQARDVSGLSQFLANPATPSPFNILKTGGGYAMGSMGWHAKLLEPKDGTAKYVVFSTPILVEDAGELLFRVNANDKLEYVPERDTLGATLDSHSFDVSFDLPNHTLFATDTIQYAWTPGGLKHFVFRISPTFKVSEIKDARGVPVPFAQAGGIVALSPDASLKSLTIAYSGTVDKPGFAHGLSPSEATLSGTVWYPMIGRRPTTYEATFTTPPDWLTLAQGDEISSEFNGTQRITKYKMDLPVVWISASCGPYKRVTTEINGIKFSTMSASGNDDEMRAQNENNAEVVDFYSETFAPYPFKTWTTLDSVQFRQGVGALEAYSFATYPAGRLPFLDSHEPGHTWWGGMINNDYIMSIWNESFTDYSQSIFKRDYPIGNMAERSDAYVADVGYSPAFDEAPLARSGQEIGPAATALGYAKGAYVLQVLEDQLGTSLFLRSLREWLKSNPSRHVGSWEDFEKVVDRVSGKDYAWFFDEWVRTAGMPDMTLTDCSWANGKFKGRVSFKGTPYKILTEGILQLPNGVSILFRPMIDPAKNGEFEIECPAKPLRAILDPYGIIARHSMPPPVSTTIRRFSRDKVYVDPRKPQTLSKLVTGTPMASLPEDLDGVFVLGAPDTTPAMQQLCRDAGFYVSGGKLTYENTMIDLAHGGAVALVDLPNGKHCLIGLGTVSQRVDFGKARLVVFDEKGHVLRAKTDPQTTGSLVVDMQ